MPGNPINRIIAGCSPKNELDAMAVVAKALRREICSKILSE